MKRIFPWIVLVLVIAFLGLCWRLTKPPRSEYDYVGFGKLPVYSEGRLKPLDTVARNSLLIMSGKDSLRLDNGKTVAATQWLADVLFNAPEANNCTVFVINNPEVLGLFGWEQKERKYFSYAELEPFLSRIQEQNSESSQHTPFQSAIINLRNALLLYWQLQSNLRPDDETRNFAEEMAAYAQLAGAMRPTMNAEKSGPLNPQLKKMFEKLTDRYGAMANASSILFVPSQGRDGKWLVLGESLLEGHIESGMSPISMGYAEMGDAYIAKNPEAFNKKVNAVSDWMNAHEPKAALSARLEFLLNQISPFHKSMALYIFVFLLVCASWLGWTQPLNRSAWLVLLLAFILHTFGLAARMMLQGRPPVTNLYSSAVFIGWGTVLLGIFLERGFRNGIGLACSSVVGFATLIIAQHLALGGETMEMMQAVLDSNFWLTTHVVTIALGYSAMFLAGVLAIIYVLWNLIIGIFFVRVLDKESAQMLARMVYGVICFATLFTFVGTVTGGIWADQAWGRFWGWDPKENGALLIALWCAIILHARWGGFVRERGLMIMALFGNIVTSFSWFGVNMLGVGLHSYGFMEKAFPWLLGFIASQMVLMAVAALLPDRDRKTPIALADEVR